MWRNSLNPCFSGGWSRSPRVEGRNHGEKRVLILVLVEDGLGDALLATASDEDKAVLILVLVEDGLGGVALKYKDADDGGVLILVLVEDGLGVIKTTHNSCRTSRS